MIDKIVQVPVSKIKPYAKNPRVNDAAVKYVANSIREFGFLVPLVLDKRNVIAAGHTRLKAALALGMESVPCVYATDLTPAQIRAFRLADNRVGELAEWDAALMTGELSALKLSDISLASLGMGDSFQKLFLESSASLAPSSASFDDGLTGSAAGADDGAPNPHNSFAKRDGSSSGQDKSAVPEGSCCCPRCGYRFDL